MQTERITFLTTPDHKAALDAFAAMRGKSMGHVVREATSRYIAQSTDEDRQAEEAVDLLLTELEAAIPRWNVKLDSMEASLDRAHAAVEKALADVEATK